MRFYLASAFAAAALCAGAASAFALVDTTTFTSQLIITAECKVQSASNLDFGSYGVLDTALTTTSTIAVQCTNGQTYTISLDDGSGTGTTTTRTMEFGGEDIAYTMWKDAGFTQNWGDAGGEIMTGLAGNGAVQNYTVHGQVPAQVTPTAATYQDTVTVTVTY